ncbi:N(4)-acetylcytidine aminohydrolase [Shewanella mesophila]|uniref:N(4)-acetylcytidine aminohydrolase n=1 Tax=Shewanella mesophila TaxID=2864208 RepID=UPI001C6561CF|nr:N(4)-acetylcytidine aminohydrolase [Shewanella mesophila]QYJ84919.1 N(4)-acetylcytidine aminohydrolase [Shewanella mesophila]
MTYSIDGEITFFQRFEADILSGAKNITLRDQSESHFTVGQRLQVATFEDHRWFCDILIERVEKLAFGELNDLHAQQENMTLSELKKVIIDIYGAIDTLYLIGFSVIKS